MEKLDITKIVTKVMLIKDLNQDSEKELGCGTGFFVSYGKEDNCKKFLCTNKHVARMLSQYASKEDNSYKQKLVELDKRLMKCEQINVEQEELEEIQELKKELEQQRTAFSINKNVTLAFYLYNEINGRRDVISIPCNEADFIYDYKENYDIALLDITNLIDKNIDIHYISEALFPSAEYIQNSMDIVEDLLVVGYPVKRYDSQLHLPIINSGSTSTPYKYPYESQAYLDEVDHDTQYSSVKDKICIANVLGLPGQSGSPVLLYKREYNNQTNRIEIEYKFLGILCTVWEDIDINFEIKKYRNQLVQQSFPYHLLSRKISLCEVIKTEVIKGMLDEIINPKLEVILEQPEAAIWLNKEYGR